MAVVHATATRNAICTAVATETGASATLDFDTGGGSRVARMTFGSTPFAAPSGGSMTANTITADASATGGTAAYGVIRAAGTTEVLRFALGVTGGDLNMATLDITAGVQVSVSNFAYVACP